MDNDVFKSQKNEDEYHFSENSNTSAFTSDDAVLGTTNNKVQIFEKIKRKNIIIAIVIVLVVLSVYKLIDVLLTSNNSKNRTNVANSASKVIRTAATPVSSFNASSVQSVVKVPQSADQAGTLPLAPINTDIARLNKLEMQDTTLQNNVDKLSNQLNDLQNTISNFDSRLSALSQNIQDIASKQEQFIKQQEDKKKSILKKTQQDTHAKPIPIYYVKAVIPGRAWLISQGKSLITVSIGDNLPGYGVIESIDTNQGTIITSSGAIIGYDPENS